MHLKHENGQVIEFPIMNLRQYLSNTSLPADLTRDSNLPNGFAYVNSGTIPEYNMQTQKLVQQSTPEFDGTKWVLNYSVIEKTQQELELQTNEIVRQIIDAVQQRLDDFAKTRSYDDIKSAASYAGDPDPIFDAEGTYCRLVRSQTWRKVYDIVGEVQAGTRQMPTGYGDIVGELPELNWPE